MEHEKHPSHPPSLGALRDYWSLLMRRKLVVTAVFVIVTAVVVTGSFLIPPTFTAQTTIMIKYGREFFYRAAVGETADTTLISLEEMVNTEVEILNSRPLAEQVVEAMGPGRMYPELLEDPDLKPADLLAAAALRFQDNLTVTDILESSIIRISFDHEDRHIAADALNLLVERFKDKHVEIFSEKSFNFVATQLEAYEAKLAASEDALEAFRQANKTYSLAEQKSLLLGQRVQIETLINDADFRIAELRQRLAFFNGHTSSAEGDDPPYATESRDSLVARRGAMSLALQEADVRLAELRNQMISFREQARAQDGAVDVPSGAERTRAVEEAYIRLLDLQVREKELLANYADDSRQVSSVRTEIGMVEEFLRTQGRYLASIFEAAIRDELNLLLARREALIDQIEQVDSSIRAFDVRQTLDELAPLQARRDQIRQKLTSLDEEIRTLDRNENELRQLERHVVLNERTYQAFADRSETARIMEELDRQKMINITVIENAAPPISPSGLSKKLRVILGAFVGLFAGLAAVVFLELMKQT